MDYRTSKNRLVDQEWITLRTSSGEGLTDSGLPQRTGQAASGLEWRTRTTLKFGQVTRIDTKWVNQLLKGRLSVC